MPASPSDVNALEELLSRPDDATIQALSELSGDVMVLGAGGKMGPTLARMARRALDACGMSNRTVYAVSGFRTPGAADSLESHGVRTIRANLTQQLEVKKLPYAKNVLWLAGQKFGTSSEPATTWSNNVIAPVFAASKFAGSRIVCFSTGNVYGRIAVTGGGSIESSPLVPDGEYAASCVGRERVFEAITQVTQSPLLIYRLFYACDLRYGVLTDIALSILHRQPISLETPLVNVIWQGDANRLALRALNAAANPPVVMNITGPIVSVRDIALSIAENMGIEPLFSGDSRSDSLIANVALLEETLPYVPLQMETLLKWTASWVNDQLPLLNKPTHYEVRDGSY